MTTQQKINLDPEFVSTLSEMTLDELRSLAAITEQVDGSDEFRTVNLDALQLLGVVSDIVDTDTDGALLVLDICSDVIEIQSAPLPDEPVLPAPPPTATAHAEQRLSSIDAEIAALIAKRDTEIKPLVTTGGVQDSVIDVLNRILSDTDNVDDTQHSELLDAVSKIGSDLRIDLMYAVGAKRFQYGAVIPTGHQTAPTVLTSSNGSNETASGSSQWFVSVTRDGKTVSVPMRGKSSNRIADFNSILWNQFGISKSDINMESKSFASKCTSLTEHGITWERGAN